MEPTQTTVLRIPLRCACCGLPFAILVQAPTGWYVEIVSRHNGERHANIIPLLGVTPTVTEPVASSNPSAAQREPPPFFVRVNHADAEPLAVAN